MIKLNYLAIALAGVALLSGCKQSGEKILPTISGTPGEVAVVCSKVEWESEPGSTLRNLLCDEVPYLPQVEPMYDLFNVPQQAFNKVFQVHRNIIVIDTDKKYEEGSMTIFRDVWATPQLVIGIKAADGAHAAEVISKRANKILYTLESTERDRILTNIHNFENPDMHKVVAKVFGGAPLFPKGYTVNSQSDDFMWSSNETTYTIQSILMWKYPFRDSTDLSVEALAAKRNEITKKHIPCTMEGSYMILNPDIFPSSRPIKRGSQGMVEMRGLWEAYNDFMGGPFLSHSFLSEDGSEIITMDAFVYAPKYDKRNYLRQVEGILYSYE